MNWNTTMRESPFISEAGALVAGLSAGAPPRTTGNWDVISVLSGEEPEYEPAEAFLAESDEELGGAGWLPRWIRDRSGVRGMGQLITYHELEGETGAFEAPIDQEIQVTKVWKRPPFPAGLKNGILARATAQVHTKDLLGWFVHTTYPNPWLQRLDVDLTEAAPDVTLTFEVFKELKANMSEAELMDSVQRYLEGRHLIDLKETRYFVAHVYTMRATTLGQRLGLDLAPLIAAAKIAGVSQAEADKHFLVVYASFPTSLEHSMLPEQQFLLQRFVFNHWELTDQHKQQIEEIAQRIVQSASSTQPIRLVRLMGHADSIGGTGVNIDIGLARANSVEEGLKVAIERLQAGLSKSIQFHFDSLGKEAPLANNNTEDGRAQNRRVEVFISGLGKAPAVTGHLQRVPIEDVSLRGLALLKQPQFNLTAEQVDRASCYLRKVLAPDVDDRFVDGQMVLSAWNTGRPRPEFIFMREGWLTVKDAFGPDVDDATFVRRLADLDGKIIEGVEQVNRIMAVQGGATSHGIETLRAWILHQLQNEVSVYSCYQGI